MTAPKPKDMTSGLVLVCAVGALTFAVVLGYAAGREDWAAQRYVISSQRDAISIQQQTIETQDRRIKALHRRIERMGDNEPCRK